MLSFLYNHRAAWNREEFDITCIELNPDYIEVGKKILPTATWIQADIFDIHDLELGDFDTVIGNPPFGNTPRFGKSSFHYTGTRFEYHAIDLAMHYANWGVFIIPQTSAPFAYSGRQGMQVQKTQQYVEFSEKTGLELSPSCGLDTSSYQNQWHGVAPVVEIVTCEMSAIERLQRHSEMIGLYDEKVG